MRMKRGKTPLKVVLTPSQIKLLEAGTKDAEGYIFLPLIFKRIEKGSMIFESAHIFDVHPELYARIVTFSIHEHTKDDPKNKSGEPNHSH